MVTKAEKDRITSAQFLLKTPRVNDKITKRINYINERLPQASRRSTDTLIQEKQFLEYLHVHTRSDFADLTDVAKNTLLKGLRIYVTGEQAEGT